MTIATPAPPVRTAADLDRADYARFLAEFSLTAEWVAQVSANESDQIAMPSGYCMRVKPSTIHGLGMFAPCLVPKGEIIAPARVGGKRTPAGRYVNHSATPNAVAQLHMGVPDGDIALVALRAIGTGEEVLVDYRQTCRLNGIGTPPKAPPATVSPTAAAVAAFAAMPRREQMTSLIADLMMHGARDAGLLKHTICNGMYMRELFIPAGMLLAGKVHKVPCLNICSSGDIEIITEHGMLRAGAGFTAASSAGTQKIGYAYADTVWINVFRTDLTDLDAIERAIFMDDAEMIAYLDAAGRHFTHYLTQEPA